MRQTTAPAFQHPVFIVASPRAGTSLLFETLALSPSLWTVGGESHALIEGIPALHPANRGFDSNRLTAVDATPEIVDQLTDAFRQALRDRDGQPPPAGAAGLRWLEKTPKNAVRVPFLAAAFPDATFLYLYRDPRETVSSILDAWRSGRFATYPNLPDWPGVPWSLLLVPGWRELAGRPLAEIATRQWEIATRTLLDDLSALPPDRWCVASYDRLVADPQGEVDRLCAHLDLAWDRPLSAPLPPSRHTLTSPAPDKWRHNAAELRSVMPLAVETAERARQFFAPPPPTRPHRPVSPAEAPRRRRAPAAPPPKKSAPAAAPNPGDPHSFHSVHTAGLAELLARAKFSLLVSTYQSGRVIAVRADDGALNTHLRALPSPMGLALGPDSLAIGTLRQVWHYWNQPAVAAKLEPAGKHDACFVPRSCNVTGDIRIHELAFAGAELWVVNTRFSCLATLDPNYSFVPRWRPRFVTALAAEDRCHLNGLAVVDGRVRYVTALGETDDPQGWRERKADGGCLLEVDSGEKVARGLSMPHSPRWHAGKLWVLESGRGTLAVVDPANGKVETVVELPGFTRGLAFAGPYAFVGLSQVRESVFGGIPLAQRLAERSCGVWVVDLRSGTVAGFLRFEGRIQEISDVLVLPGIRYPELAEPESELVSGAFVIPDANLAETAAGRTPGDK